MEDPVWDTGIDYLSSVEEVYTSLAKWQVKTSPRDLRILLAAILFRSPDCQNSTLPTWVPDWRYLPQNKPLKFINYMNHRRKHFTYIHDMRPIEVEENQLLVSVGAFFTISSIWQLSGQEAQGKYPPGSLSMTMLRALRHAYENLNDSHNLSNETTSRPTFDDAFSMILESVGDFEPPQMREILEWLWSAHPDQKLSREHVLFIQQSFWKRSIFLTDTHDLGVGPGEAEVGDIISYAGSLTLCLRGVGPGMYTLVGDGFICQKIIDSPKDFILLGENWNQNLQIKIV
jgi:hypothetical protein